MVFISASCYWMLCLHARINCSNKELRQCIGELEARFRRQYARVSFLDIVKSVTHCDSWYLIERASPRRKSVAKGIRVVPGSE